MNDEVETKPKCETSRCEGTAEWIVAITRQKPWHLCNFCKEVIETLATPPPRSRKRGNIIFEAKRLNGGGV